MHIHFRCHAALAALLVPFQAALLGGALHAQTTAPNVVVPQVRAARMSDDVRGITIERVDVRATVTRQIATTTLEIRLSNTDDRPQEAELLVPVPDGAVVRGFDFLGEAAEPTARVLPRDEARETYDRIVAEVLDPALLEFARHSLVRSSVFPVPPKGHQQVRLVYENVLDVRGRRIEWVLPKSEALLGAWVPWNVTVEFDADLPISTIYSPTHDLEIERHGPNRAVATIGGLSARQPGTVRISQLLAGDGLSTSLWAQPDARVGGGHFLFLAGVPAEIDEDARLRMLREVILVIDRSGSMEGDKLVQARDAALQIVQGLREGEAFNIVDYSDELAYFRPGPVLCTPENAAAARSYLNSMRAGGGTALDAALRTALSQEHVEDRVPVVLFLTDGLPSTGETQEVAIRENARAANVHGRRIFTFGVGDDVNVPMLDGIASSTGGKSAFVRPGENVEIAVSRVVERLRGPVMAGNTLRVLDQDGAPAPHRVAQLVPNEVPDLYEHDQVLLLGIYRGRAPLAFELSGNYLGEPRTFRFDFDIAEAEDPRNAFVSRLWASRRIGELVELVRQAGADPSRSANEKAFRSDPALVEYMRSIVELSVEYGVLTEYTAFLALEGTDLSQPGPVYDEVERNLVVKAMRDRVGSRARDRSTNVQARLQQQSLNRFNSFVDDSSRTVQSGDVRQAGDRAFFRRGNVWVDSRLVGIPAPIRVDLLVRFGSQRHRDLVERFALQGRGGVFSLRGRIIVDVDGVVVLITAPKREDGAVAAAD